MQVKYSSLEFQKIVQNWIPAKITKIYNILPISVKHHLQITFPTF